ncbi:hypothetical protein [Cellulomonas phragmiteti]|uniref:Uncharacterized protein n=1 Tax=Cellulomonas phragmiteti TaxID=478780 RepID=A0ABQ4DP21_9CELL|nr:hypothetical protein [Cellulomonas phragmiteti]GIG40671.1 hypothetical protein Cph01nite_24330 [Cellulomonas phragmiteti]
MTTTPTTTATGVTRRTVLAAGAGVAGAVTLGAAAGVQVLFPDLPLDGEVLSRMVGQTFVDTQTGARLVLATVDGFAGAAATAEQFALVLVADGEPLPAATRTLRHPDGDLRVYLGPVSPDGLTLEAVVNRAGGAR